MIQFWNFIYDIYSSLLKTSSDLIAQCSGELETWNAFLLDKQRNSKMLILYITFNILLKLKILIKTTLIQI